MMNMKTAGISIVAVGLILTSCENPNAANREKTLNQLEHFVDSVESELSKESKKGWAEAEREFERLEAKAESAWENATNQEQDRLDRISERFEAARAEAEMYADKIKIEAEHHLDNLENLLDRTMDKAENSAEKTGESISSTIEESMKWLEANFDELSENSKEEFQKLKDKLSNEQP